MCKAVTSFVKGAINRGKATFKGVHGLTDQFTNRLSGKYARDKAARAAANAAAEAKAKAAAAEAEKQRKIKENKSLLDKKINDRDYDDIRLNVKSHYTKSLLNTTR